jgi:hypothetical protein
MLLSNRLTSREVDWLRRGIEPLPLLSFKWWHEDLGRTVS